MNLGKADAGQPASQSRVETPGSGDEEISARQATMPHEVDIHGDPVETFGEAAFDFRDLMAQRRNGSPRHGRGGHGVQLSRRLFLLCSY
jgi:hypothetical protein